MNRIIFVVLTMLLPINSYSGFATLSRSETCAVTANALSLYWQAFYDTGGNISFKEVEDLKLVAKTYSETYILHFIQENSEAFTKDNYEKKIAEVTLKTIIPKRDILFKNIINERSIGQTEVLQNLISRLEKCTDELNHAEQL